MAGYRMDRINEDIMREITAILRTVKDPRVTAGMLSVVRVEVTNDMSYAKVYVSAMEGIETAKKAVEGLVWHRDISGGSLAAPCICAMCPSLDLSPTIRWNTALI